MLNAYTLQQPKNIAELANFAFGFQSIANGKVSNGKYIQGKFINKDVREAYDAFDTFKSAPNDLTVVTAFRDAAKICEDCARSGFEDLVAALEQKVATLSVTTSTPTVSTSAIKSPRA